MQNLIHIALMHHLESEKQNNPSKLTDHFATLQNNREELLTALISLSSLFTEYAIDRDGEMAKLKAEIAIGIGLTFSYLSQQLRITLDSQENLDRAITEQMINQAKQEQGAE